MLVLAINAHCASHCRLSWSWKTEAECSVQLRFSTRGETYVWMPYTLPRSRRWPGRWLLLRASMVFLEPSLCRVSSFNTKLHGHNAHSSFVLKLLRRRRNFIYNVKETNDSSPYLTLFAKCILPWLSFSTLVTREIPATHYAYCAPHSVCWHIRDVRCFSTSHMETKTKYFTGILSASSAFQALALPPIYMEI